MGCTDYTGDGVKVFRKIFAPLPAGGNWHIVLVVAVISCPWPLVYRFVLGRYCENFKRCKSFVYRLDDLAE